MCCTMVVYFRLLVAASAKDRFELSNKKQITDMSESEWITAWRNTYTYCVPYCRKNAYSVYIFYL
jgi:hypothetical protein